MRSFTLFVTLLSVVLCSFTSALAQAPVANFTANVTSGCSPVVVTFQNQSSNSTSWTWDFGNGATSTRQSPSATYFNPGTYTVRLTATNANGSNSVTKQAFVTVYDVPKVQFAVDKASGCAPVQVQFTDQSTAAAGTSNTKWLWAFGDGTESDLQHPSVTYRNPDSYAVSLTVTNDKGCSQTAVRSGLVTVGTPPASAFTASSPSACKAPASVSFANSSTGSGTLTYTWYFGDGEKSNEIAPAHIYKANGTYTVSLVTRNNLGCIDSISKQTFITIGGITTDFTVPTLCERNNGQLLNNSSPAPLSSVWRFSNGTTAATRDAAPYFANPGTYTVKLVNTYSYCADSITKTVTVLPRPQLNFETPQLINCKVPFTAAFRNTSAGLPDNAFSWSFGNGTTSTEKNPQVTYTREGSFTVILTGTSTAGCADTLTKTNYIRIARPILSAREIPAKGCVPFSFSPKPEITALDSVETYRWDFGDGASSTDSLPVHVYQQQGTYEVRLTITSSTGCTVTKTFNDAVKTGTVPTADFSASETEVCAEKSVTFKNLSSQPTDSYLWEFGDGQTSTETDPVHKFTNVGPMKVSLTAINNGCSTTVKRDNVVTIKAPIARFTATPSTACIVTNGKRLTYTFNNSSLVLGSQAEWSFSDGSPVETTWLPRPHTFPNYGTWKVTLKLTNGTCSYTTSQDITIVDPKLDFTATEREGCRSFKTTFQASSQGQVKTYTWYFGDGKIQPTNAAQYSHTYTAAKVYDVMLITTDNSNCKDTVTKSKFIQVNGPTAAFTAADFQGCKGLTAKFTDNSPSSNPGAPVSWTWDFGDGTSEVHSNAQPVQHRYDTTGVFNVKLVVRDGAGCKDSTTFRSVRASVVRANWNVTRETCPGTELAFSNTSSSNLGAYTSTWTFGDGRTSDLQRPTYAYTDTGFFTVKLKVRDIQGCEAELERPAYVYVGKPVADFSVNSEVSYCPSFTARFTDKSTYANKWAWDLDTITTQQRNPVITYRSRRTYNVKLTVTSPGGCTADTTRQVTLRDPEGSFTYNYLSACNPVPVTFQALDGMKARLTWDFGNGDILADTAANRISYTYTDFGSFTPAVILTDRACPLYLTGKDPIEVLGIKTQFEIDRQLLCDSGRVRLTAQTETSGKLAGYFWDFGDGQTLPTDQSSLEHFYAAPGRYSVSLIARTEAGCADTLLNQGPISVVQRPVVEIHGDSAVCQNGRIQYTGNLLRPDTSAVRWSWVFPNGNAATVQNPAGQQFVRAGQFTVRAVVTNSSGCSTEATRALTIHSLPVITLPANLTMRVGFPTVIPATYSSRMATYSWLPANSTLSCTDCPQPTVGNIGNDTKYSVAVTDSNGCKNTGEVQVHLFCQNANVFVPNTFSPNGDGSNDVFRVLGRGVDRVKSFRVFNRWGEMVFEKREYALSDASAGWDGRYKGRAPVADVYVYQLEAYCDNGQIIQFSGNVALIQ
ncbi:PKD domain-containing protein [Paraflavisolibacter sp. H34]|uniref:PKD domain-containing protein n=1 Tax=Huijunlia imazamoxiresistens TaxID=3127457 RepID=UPI0030187B6A